MTHLDGGLTPAGGTQQVPISTAEDLAVLAVCLETDLALRNLRLLSDPLPPPRMVVVVVVVVVVLSVRNGAVRLHHNWPSELLSNSRAGSDHLHSTDDHDLPLLSRPLLVSEEVPQHPDDSVLLQLSIVDHIIELASQEDEAVVAVSVIQHKLVPER